LPFKKAEDSARPKNGGQLGGGFRQARREAFAWLVAWLIVWGFRQAHGDASARHGNGLLASAHRTCQLEASARHGSTPGGAGSGRPPADVSTRHGMDGKVGIAATALLWKSIKEASAGRQGIFPPASTAACRGAPAYMRVSVLNGGGGYGEYASPRRM